MNILSMARFSSLLSPYITPCDISSFPTTFPAVFMPAFRDVPQLPFATVPIIFTSLATVRTPPLTVLIPLATVFNPLPAFTPFMAALAPFTINLLAPPQATERAMLQAFDMPHSFKSNSPVTIPTTPSMQSDTPSDIKPIPTELIVPTVKTARQTPATICAHPKIKTPSASQENLGFFSTEKATSKPRSFNP